MSYNNLKIIEALSPRECVEARIKATEKLKSPHLANIEAVLTKPEGSSYLLKERYYGANIVTDAGDIYYAQLGANDSVTNDFVANGRLALRTSADTPAKGNTYSALTTVVAGTQSSVYTGYPTANDGDADNTASNKQRKVTWRYEHGTSVANASAIKGGAIHSGAGSPSGATPLLTHFTFGAQFDKTSSDTLKVIINHDFLGA